MEALFAMQWKDRRVACFVIFGIFLAGLGAASAMGAQPASPQTTLAGELRSLAGRAAVVFAGQVVSIERRGSMVEVTFRVEQPVQGRVGGSYTLREWAGLWPPGQFRYQVGERALIFVHGTSAAGFASPVDGAEGVVPLVVQGANAPELLDVRRLSAALKRAPGTPLPTEGQGAISLSDALKLITGPTGSAVLEPVRGPLPTHGAPVRPVPVARQRTAVSAIIPGMTPGHQQGGMVLDVTR